MTDKELKDWCKTCNVEPPAMKFKCPECEHNPDNEQIIDGVDVSGCKHYKINGKCRIPHYQQGIKYVNCNCNEWDCYYKQLKRKEQECEKLRGDFHSTNEQLKDYKEHYDKQSEEHQKLKQDLFLAQNQITLKNEYIQKVKQEREKLKSQVDEDYNYYTTELKTLRDIISNKEKRNAALSLTSGRYHKALDEIEKELKEGVYCESQECGCDDFEECLKCTKEHILDIINKAKKVKSSR